MPQLVGGLERASEVLHGRPWRVQASRLGASSSAVFEGSCPEPRRMIVLRQLGQVWVAIVRVGLLHRLARRADAAAAARVPEAGV